ncbi:hypothetical protein DZ860_08265 [Vibrio sinensis]|uniref:Glycosyl transferase n=1 Tax=Vibrio sinensis TaxID=2302434 RepID=A0A3A6QIM1_9VIBR|nr:hypothetical protein [Vibrio sinensis]RJX72395.1 hypothetical protein DZ860_08265 [Vibrio sinensis]
MESKQYLTFVIYGHDLTYYQGARFGILSFLANWHGKNRPQVVVLTEETEHFDDLPILVIPITSEQKNDWSLGNNYHFRIKNRGLKYISKYINLQPEDKLVFLDTDTYFTQATNIYFDSITSKKALMYFPEVKINDLPESNEYAIIRNKNHLLADGSSYRVTDKSTMWASAVIGVTGSMINSLDYADMLITTLRENGCRAHTLEQYALSEALSRDVELVAAKSWLNHYSTSGRKDWGRKVLQRFFAQYGQLSFEEQIERAKKVSFARPLSEVIRGHIYKKKKKLLALFKNTSSK